ncbi:MAG: sulfite exporter TauE/SafE family protein [Gaiellales bacterium]
MMMTDAHEIVVIALAGLAAGFVNSIASGGNLIAFPVLMALGMPPILANVTSTVSVTPSSASGAFAQRSRLAGQRPRIRLLLPVAMAGALIGAGLLLVTPDDVFEYLIPVLLALGVTFVIVSPVIKRRLGLVCSLEPTGRRALAVSATGLFVAGLYGGYSGGGLGIIILAVLGAAIVDSVTRILALKQLLSATIGVTATSIFLFSGDIVWIAAGVMLACALTGGFVGGHMANRVSPIVLRYVIITIGLIVTVVFAVRIYL